MSSCVVSCYIASYVGRCRHVTRTLCPAQFNPFISSPLFVSRLLFASHTADNLILLISTISPYATSARTSIYSYPATRSTSCRVDRISHPMVQHTIHRCAAPHKCLANHILAFIFSIEKTALTTMYRSFPIFTLMCSSFFVKQNKK